MRPNVILHNTISLDGRLTGFEPDLALHYGVAGRFEAQAQLIGSATAKRGVEMFGTQDAETDSDMRRPDPQEDDRRPIWVLVDSRGTLMGMLHHYRRFEHCRDVVLLVSEQTPRDYRTYLDERGYPYHVCGEEQVDLAAALEWLHDELGVEQVVTDAGAGLNTVLLAKGLVDQVSLVIAPSLVGEREGSLCATLPREIGLKLNARDASSDGWVWLLYDVED